MTGRHPNRLNTFHTIVGRSLLFADETLLPEVLGRGGYATGMFGKWHLGDNYPFRPEDRGFDEVVRHGGGGIGQMPDYWGNDYFDDTYWHNGMPERYTGYCADVFFEEAMDFMADNRDRPFFCYIATNAPHFPRNLPAEYLDRYRGHPELTESEARFYGMVTNIDDNFARLENHLAQLGLRENTLLIFMTDNGSAGGQRIFDAGMTGGKGTVTEGGHRVPLYLRWPAADLDGGRDVDHLAAHVDLFPTLLELTNTAYESNKPLDGRSLVPDLTNANYTPPPRTLIVDHQRELNLVRGNTNAVMRENWRLLSDTALYDLATDPHQTRNVMAEYPDIANGLRRDYANWWASLLDERVDERFAYIRVGSPAERISRLTSHDLHGSKAMGTWNQVGAIRANPAAGRWRIAAERGGHYRIALRRFPRESGLAINATFPAVPPPLEIADTIPASRKDDFVEAYLYVPGSKLLREITRGEEEVVFTVPIAQGKHEMEARLIDANGVHHPAYYVYVEYLE
jgi:arylsulfatase A-like enzyme